MRREAVVALAISVLSLRASFLRLQSLLRLHRRRTARATSTYFNVRDCDQDVVRIDH